MSLQKAKKYFFEQLWSSFPLLSVAAPFKHLTKKSGHLLFSLLFHQLALTSLSLAMSARREGQRGRFYVRRVENLSSS